MTTKTAFDSIKLSHPCDLCKGTICLGDNTIMLKNRLIHFECYENEVTEEELRFLRKLQNEGSKYAIREMIDFRIKELKEKTK